MRPVFVYFVGKTQCAPRYRVLVLRVRLKPDPQRVYDKCNQSRTISMAMP